MTELHIILELDNALKGEDFSKLIQTEDITIGCLDGGMTSGNPSIGIIVKLPDGKFVFAQTSLKLFQTANDIFFSKFGRV